MSEYKALAQAIKILGDARTECSKEYGGYFNSPADDKLMHAQQYLSKQAAALVGDEAA